MPKKRNTGLPKIEKLSSGAYHARAYVGKDPSTGKASYRSFTNYDYNALLLELAQFKQDRRENKISNATGRLTLTVGEAIDEYIEIKKNVLSPSTVRSYRAVRRSSLQDIMQFRVDQLTQEVIQMAVNRDAARLSPKSVRNAHGLLTGMLTIYRPNFTLHTTLPQKEKKEIEVPTEDEVAKLIHTARGTNMELPIMLAACCGMRPSEISALRWSNVDFKRRTLSIKSAVVRNDKNEYVEKGTKTTAGTRTIRLFPLMHTALKEAYEAADQKDGYICISPRKITDRFHTILRQSGVRSMRFYDLRHYVVSVMLSLNIPKNYIADYVGHENENMIDRVYGHIMKNKKTAVEDVMQEYFSGVFNE